MFFSAMKDFLEVYVCRRNAQATESPAPLCARSPLFVPGSLPVLISEFTDQYRMVNGVNAVGGRGT